jgi:tRNA pseudouridine13 synthase
LVYEVDQDSNVIHIKSLEMPKPPAKKAKDVGDPASEVNTDVTSGGPSVAPENTEAEFGSEAPAGVVDETHGDSSQQKSSTVPWPDSFSTRLSPFLSTEKMQEVKQMFLEGPEPPFVSDAGWTGRLASKTNESAASGSVDIEKTVEMRSDTDGKKGNNKRGRDRGGRGGRGRGRGGRAIREDHRKVVSEVRNFSYRVTVSLNHAVSQPIVSKQTRTSFHQTIRELFGGKLDSETEMNESVNTDEGSRIVIRWTRSGGGGRRGGKQTFITMSNCSNTQTYRRRARSTGDLPSIHTFNASKDEPRHAGCLAISCSYPARSCKRSFHGRHQG